MARPNPDFAIYLVHLAFWGAFGPGADVHGAEAA